MRNNAIIFMSLFIKKINEKKNLLFKKVLKWLFALKPLYISHFWLFCELSVDSFSHFLKNSNSFCFKTENFSCSTIIFNFIVFDCLISVRLIILYVRIFKVFKKLKINIRKELIFSSFSSMLPQINYNDE